MKEVQFEIKVDIILPELIQLGILQCTIYLSVYTHMRIIIFPSLFDIAHFRVNINVVIIGFFFLDFFMLLIAVK